MSGGQLAAGRRRFRLLVDVPREPHKEGHYEIEDGDGGGEDEAQKDELEDELQPERQVARVVEGVGLVHQLLVGRDAGEQLARGLDVEDSDAFDEDVDEERIRKKDVDDGRRAEGVPLAVWCNGCNVCNGV